MSPRNKGLITDGICGDWDGDKSNDYYYSEWASTDKWNRTDAVPLGAQLKESSLPAGVEQKTCNAQGTKKYDLIEDFLLENDNEERRRRDVTSPPPTPTCQASQLVEMAASALGVSAQIELEALLEGADLDLEVGIETACDDIQEEAYESMRIALEDTNHQKIIDLFNLNPEGCNFPKGEPTVKGCVCQSGFGDLACNVDLFQPVTAGKLRMAKHQCLEHDEAVFVEVFNFNSKSKATCNFNGKEVAGEFEFGSSFVKCMPPASAIAADDIKLT
eukprot:Awhi_evm1s4297